MKPFDILDALSDLPEEYTAFAARDHASHKTAEQDKSERAEIIMKQNNKSGGRSFRIGKVSVAAIIAACIGLNAALIYGISRMRQDDGITIPAAEVSVTTAAPESEPEPETVLSETGSRFMKISDAMPTGVIVDITNDTDSELAYHEKFIVMQDGKKVADAEVPSRFRYVQNPIPQGSCGQQLCFSQLPAGRYTLVNLAEDGVTEGALGHADFEISADFDNMVYIPDVNKDLCLQKYEEVEAILQEKGARVEKRTLICTEKGVEKGDVLAMIVAPDQSDETGAPLRYHYDGNGYWIQTGETVALHVSGGTEGDSATVPYLIGQDIEKARTALANCGFYIDERAAYFDDYPVNAIVMETVGDEPVPEEGMEAPLGSYVRLAVNLGRESADTDTVTVPEFTGMDWATALSQAEEVGLIVGKQYRDMQGVSDRFVIGQSYQPGDEVPKGFVIMLEVTKMQDDQFVNLTFALPENLKGDYYIYVCDAQSIMGYSRMFSAEDGAQTVSVAADCAEQNAPVQAILVNAASKQEAVIGSYTLHPDTGTYETVTEDIEAALRHVQPVENP